MLRAFGFIAAIGLIGSVASAQTPAKPKPALYDAKLDADAQIERAVANAKRDGSRVLVMFGFNGCSWCHKLHDLFGKDAAIRKTLRDEYQLVMVDIASPHAREWLDRSHAALPKEVDAKSTGFPFLAVLDENGKVVKAQATGPLEKDGGHDPAKVREVLEAAKAPPRDARKALADALARAKSEDKRVFVHFGAPWCGWCHKLDDYLALDDVAKTFATDYVDLKIDTQRTKEGQAILDEFSGGKSGGIPWFVVLDAEGKPLADSFGPKGNIGYPAQPEEIAHFVGVLRKTARRIEPAGIDQLKRRLERKAEELKFPR